jgi:hypothetical protein
MQKDKLRELSVILYIRLQRKAAIDWTLKELYFKRFNAVLCLILCSGD